MVCSLHFDQLSLSVMVSPDAEEASWMTAKNYPSLWVEGEEVIRLYVKGRQEQHLGHLCF